MATKEGDILLVTKDQVYTKAECLSEATTEMLGECASPDIALSKLAARPGTNLLDNWYFGNPVNQKGATEYKQQANGYTVDRWYNSAVNVTTTLGDGEVSITSTATSRRGLVQKVEHWEQLKGRTLTFSAYAHPEANMQLGVSTISPGIISQTSGNVSSADYTVFSFTFTVPEDAGCLAIWLTTAGATTIHVRAAKLELGSVQTLAHKEGGTWVLNEIPNYAEELARCQRYQLNLLAPANIGQTYIMHGIATAATTIHGVCNIPTTLAKQPTVVTDCSATVPYRIFGINNSTGYVCENGETGSVTKIAVYGYGENNVILVATGTNFVPGNSYIVFITNSNTHTFLLDANL